ncbi:MAG: aldehyde ferredoxin oxidoreductase family protein, partial [Dehalococcoidales bacterium]|nr:aldehyde ferredoxin oxidoreductase family protein [Dehalococcoidales bacterium]
VKEGMNPLAPDNPLIFAVGPFTGTTIPMVSRGAVCGVSPLTGIWGEATTGGVFPFRLKTAGFDGIMVTGRARQPVYLYLHDGTAEIRDASRLWGKDSYQTQDILKDELKVTGLSIACIGRAGENLVNYACVMNDKGRAAGRCGLGALMGSKNLKAVAVAGNQRASLADNDKLTELTNRARQTISSAIMAVVYREYGTLLYTDMGMFAGDTPAKYFSRSVFPAQKVTGHSLRQAYPVESYACYGCPIGCGRLVRGFRKDIPEVDGPEYETAVVFGPLCMNYDWDSIIHANHLCNMHGIDTISAGVAIAYAMYLYEKGILSRDRAGMEIKWGDGQTIVKLVEMIINRKGIGELLGAGVKKMAEELGADPETAAHVKGLEIPMHDPRAYSGEAISYATGPRGACHLKGDFYGAGAGIPDLGIPRTDRFQSAGIAVPAAKFQSFRDMFDSLLLCKFAPLSPSVIAEILSAITGWSFTPTDLITAGDRSINLKRAINNRLGVTPKDDKLPKINLQVLNEGGIAGKSPDMAVLLKEYYDFRKWDGNTGKPTKEKLLELGLDFAAKDLWP